MFRSALFLLCVLLATPAVLAQSAAPAPSDAPPRLDPNGTRLFLSPTARTMPQGQGRFSDYMVFFPSVAYSFTDWLDASASVSLLPGSSSQLVTFNAKARVLSTEAVDVAVGTLLGTTFGEFTGEGFGGTVYGLATVGSARRAVTIGTYLPYGGDTSVTTCSGDVCETEDNFDVDVADGVLLMLGGEVQVSNSVKLMTENYFAVGDGLTGGIASGGVRFFGDQIAVDLALLRPFEAGNDYGGFPFVPYLAFAYNFGR